ncbi:autotransporter domain-containing protein [Thalassospira sp. MA62]|nr:autotransporter domain-containing protein [Thalassospira sp. MA62]
MYFTSTARGAKTAPRHAISKPVLLAGTALVSIMLITQPALAGGAGGGADSGFIGGDGGAGNDGTLTVGAGADGAGGAAGGALGADGNDAINSSSGLGGGGGGDGIILSNNTPVSGNVFGGDGGNGGTASSPSNSGGGGGGGGAGVVTDGTSDTLTILDNAHIAGGHGGDGGGANYQLGGNAGGGGAGIGASDLTIVIGNSNSVRGGGGGDGGDGNNGGGRGGDGGDGIAGDNLIITNNGNIIGADGGEGSGDANAGNGGNGIEGANLTITNNGTIYRGSGDTSSPNSALHGIDGKAILFTGGTNRLTLGSSSEILGDISVAGSLELAQDTNATLSNTIEGTGSLTKTGSGNLTLTGTNTYSGGTTISTGTLTGSTTSLQGDVENNAALVVDQSSNGTFADDISGTGSLTKTGSGNLTLSGTNTYSGGTTISAGTLTGSTTSLQGDVENNASLVVDQSSNGTFADDISGTGSLTKTGSGNLTLTGTNTYSGGTTISAGTLTGSTTSLQGDIENNASLVFDQDTSGSFEDNISGTGALTIAGNAVVTLRGTNTHTGGTTVSAGTLQIANAGSITGNILNDATLSFFRADGYENTYADVISGTGMVMLNGNGTQTLTATNTYTGNTIISGGTLVVNGSIASSSRTSVNNGGRLAGTGTVGQTTVSAGGVHAPGNSIGTQTVDGDYTLVGTLEIEVDQTSADQLIVNGDVDLGGTLRIVGLPGNDMDGEDSYTHTIIDNRGTNLVDGTFDTVDNRLAFYDEEITYNVGADNQDVIMTLTRNQNSLGDVAQTPNQSAVADKIAMMPGTDGTTIENAILGLSTKQAAHAYEQLSADAYTSIREVTNQVTRQTSAEIGARMASLGTRQSGQSAGLVAASTLSPAALSGFAQAGPASTDATAYDSDAPMLALGNGLGTQSGAAVWVQAIGGKGRIDGDGNSDTTDYKWAGVMGGYDTRISENTVVGLYFGYADGQNRQSQRDATLDTTNLMAGVYGTHDMGNDWRLSAQAGWTRIAVDSDRNLDFGGINRTATADYTDHTVNADLEIAKGFDIDRNWRVEPFGGFGMLWNHQSSFSETGADAANITRKSDDDFSGTASLGVRFAGLIDTGNGQTIIPKFGLSWDHHLGPVTNSSTLSFGSSPSFTVTGTDRDRDTLVGNLGLVLADVDGWSLYGDYQPSVSEDRVEHALGAGFRLEF